MRIVSIDSSLGSQIVIADADAPGADAASAVAVVTVAQASEDSSRRHAESLGPMLASVLEQAGPDLDLVIAATGPAPFTGLRAGLVTARTLARARDLELLGVPSLDAVARRAFDEVAATAGAPGADVEVLVTTDARRKEVYAARYRANGADDVTRLGDIEVLAPAVVAQRLADEWACVTHVAGSGAVLYPDMVGQRPVVAGVSGDAGVQVRVGLARRARGVEQGTEPLYLRHADVQMPTAPKRHS